MQHIKRLAVVMNELEIERALGYTPCVCGVIDGTWHPRCYVGKTPSEIADAYKQAFAKARTYPKNKAMQAADRASAQAQVKGGAK